MLKICNDILLITVLRKVNAAACARAHCGLGASADVAARRAGSNAQRRRRRGGSAAALGAGRRYVAVWSHGVSHDTDALKRWLRAPAHALRLANALCVQITPNDGCYGIKFGDSSLTGELPGIPFRSPRSVGTDDIILSYSSSVC